MEEILNFILPALAVGLGATLQASVGYGYGLVSVPLLILINPSFIPAPFIFVSLILMLTVSYRYRSALVGENFNWVFIGLALGTPLGVLLLKSVKGVNFSLVVAIIIALGIIASMMSVKVNINRVTQSITGFLSAIMGTVSGVGGAPIALLYQNEPGKDIRAALSLMFFVASLFSFVGILFGGLFRQEELVLSLYLFPGIVLGHWLGPHLARFTDKGYSRAAILTLSMASVIGILIKNV